MNNVSLIGRLTKDVDLRYTQTNNKAVASFTLAVKRAYKQEGQQEADFINIIAWGATAEFSSKYFKKGQQVAVVGRIQTRNYDDKDGKKVYVTEVVAEHVYFASDSKSQNDNTNDNTYVDPFANTNNDDDLPF